MIQNELDNPSYYINREISWLEFNHRVLEEAQDDSNPLLEKLKFLSIVSSNLDEFFMIRVASIMDQIFVGFDKPDFSGLTPRQQIKEISIRAHKMVEEQYKTYKKSIRLLKKEGINFIKGQDLSARQRDYLDTYYWKTIYPVLTPMAVDKSRPFPLLLNKSLNIALLLKQNGEDGNNIFATVQIPSVLNRWVEIPSDRGERSFILLEEIIKLYMETLFKGHEILSMGCFRITRNADLGFDEEGAEDLLEAIEQLIKKRKWGRVIRLEVEQGMEDSLLNILKEEMEVHDGGVYHIPLALDLTFLMKFSGLKGLQHLRHNYLIPQPSPEFNGYEDIFEAIGEKDILLHHPYQSFYPVVALVKKAARDPKVLAIKQTLYRVSGNSPVVEALAEAAENGKQVTVLLELKARFDEANNINWAKRLEQAGCHVIYGLVGLKTHCKLLLIVRREEDGIKRYVHLGTGNYNDVTARLYTDMGIFTSNHYFGADASAVFNMLSGYSQLDKLYKLDIAPMGLRKKFIKLIRTEADNAKKGIKASIVAKMNSLVDEEIIKELYMASQVGVKIELIVRGICCLKPGIPQISENITVRSIVGRFLEHSRIYCFHDGGNELVYLSSADWMPRNLDRRVELLFPVEDEKILRQITKIFDIILKDTEKARILNMKGEYSKIKNEGRESINSQEFLYKMAVNMAEGLSKTED